MVPHPIRSTRRAHQQSHTVETAEQTLDSPSRHERGASRRRSTSLSQADDNTSPGHAGDTARPRWVLAARAPNLTSLSTHRAYHSPFLSAVEHTHRGTHFASDIKSSTTTPPTAASEPPSHAIRVEPPAFSPRTVCWPVDRRSHSTAYLTSHTVNVKALGWFPKLLARMCAKLCTLHLTFSLLHRVPRCLAVRVIHTYAPRRR